MWPCLCTKHTDPKDGCDLSLGNTDNTVQFQMLPPTEQDQLAFCIHISVHPKSVDLEDQWDAVLSILYLFYCQVTLHVSDVSRAYHQEHTNCSYNHWYKSWIWRYNDKILLKRFHGRAAAAWLVPVVVTTVCVLLMMGAGDIRNM
jgi:hypothetical protein